MSETDFESLLHALSSSSVCTSSLCSRHRKFFATAHYALDTEKSVREHDAQFRKFGPVQTRKGCLYRSMFRIEPEEKPLLSVGRQHPSQKWRGLRPDVLYVERFLEMDLTCQTDFWIGIHCSHTWWIQSEQSRRKMGMGGFNIGQSTDL